MLNKTCFRQVSRIWETKNKSPKKIMLNKTKTANKKYGKKLVMMQNSQITGRGGQAV